MYTPLHRSALGLAACISFVAISAGCSFGPPAPRSAASASTAPSATASEQADTTTLVVSAAQSLKDPLTMLATKFESSNPHTKLTLNFGGSGQLAQQIEQGAPVDLFLSASPKDPDALRAKGLVEAGTYRPFLSNVLVVAVPKTNPGGVRDLKSLTGGAVKRWVTGDPSSVPHGACAQQSLESLGIWGAVKDKAVFSQNVAQTLAYIEQGAVDAGVLFRSEAERKQASGLVRIVYVVPSGLHMPIEYVGVVVKGTKNGQAARAFQAFVGGPEALKVFQAAGFEPLGGK